MAKKDVKEEVVETQEPVQEAAAEAQSTALVSYEDQLAQYAQEAAENESLVGTFLSTKNGRLSINGNPVAGNVLNCIVSAVIGENAFYPGKFDPNNPTPPRCYAFGNDEATIKPHPDVVNPIHHECFSCPNNQWKSDGDKGKACKNVRRLSLIAADAVEEPSKLVGSDRLYLKIPVTSVKDWAKYVHSVSAEFKRPPFAVITAISAVPDDKTQFKLTFKCEGRVPQEAVGALIEAHKVDEDSIGFPYPALSEAASAKDSEKF